MRSLSVKVGIRKKCHIWNSESISAHGTLLQNGLDDNIACCKTLWSALFKAKRSVNECPKQNTIKEKSI